MTAPTFAAWTAWLAFLGPEEGTLSLDPTDTGNWTGGAVGRGTLVGTKYGISAASYPTLDIAALTLDQANAIRQTDFWDKVRGDELPAPIAFMVTDAAFMSGPDRAIRQMQQALGVSPVDGVLGAHTLAAAHAAKTLDFLTEFAALRLLFLNTLGPWSVDKGGWIRRLFHGALTASGLAAS